MPDSLTSAELRDLLASAAPVTLLDVRRDNDRAAHPVSIPGATWRAPEEVDVWSKDLSMAVPVVVYCVRGGSVSTSVQASLKQHGFDVRYLEGGLAAFTSPAD